MKPAIVWFRRDLRLSDNPALNRAVESGRPVLPVYIVDELDTQSASRWWLHHSLTVLRGKLESLGGSLTLLKGDASAKLAELAAATDAEVIYCCHRYEAEGRAQLIALRNALPESVRLNAAHGSLLNEPGTVVTGSGSVFKVFTPFYKAAMRVPVPAPDTKTPVSFHASPDDADSNVLDSLLPTINWADGFPEDWTPGETAASDRLDHAVKKSADYGELRDRPDLEGTSRLSPHMHYGEVSIREVWHRLSEVGGAEPLTRQLYWRDFSYHLLVENPDMGWKPLRREFDNFPWVDDDVLLRAWQTGQTGYPIVDAGMRQLWRTGWMHNRVRMIVASFLVKHLLVPWQRGADWFLDTLLDADLANNSAGWQWVAGCGTDATPYFRIFNPITQGKKFDVSGDYVRKFVPELDKVPTKFIHDPWNAGTDLLAASSIRLGEDYPYPIVEHKEARQRALDAYQLSRDLLKSAAE
ncbi:MAG: deoxyribodipyrimidine photo-lyase [Pseudomonadota bacterium]